MAYPPAKDSEIFISGPQLYPVLQNCVSNAHYTLWILPQVQHIQKLCSLSFLEIYATTHIPNVVKGVQDTSL
jgi:hypothetical protein